MDDETSGQQIIIQTTHIGADTLISDDQVERIIKFTCSKFKITNAVISIAVVDNDNIRRINKEFLNKDNITDCISFDLSDEQSELSLEIIVNAELAELQAGSKKHDSEAELALYIVHGLLHQMGFDDQTPDRAEKMHSTEEKILRELGYDFSYN